MLDPVRSAVEVRVGGIVAGLPALGGMLRRPSAETWLDAEMTVLLDAGNLETGDPRWNDRLRLLRAFGIANHPHIRLVGIIGSPTTSVHLELRGTMEFKGQVVPLLMEVHCLDERAGARRLLVEGAVTTQERVLLCEVDAADDRRLERMDIVIHAEWIETSDPMPAA